MKLKILILLTLVAIGAVGFYVYNTSKNTESFQSPISDNKQNTSQSAVNITDDAASGKTKEYKDPSGFKFSYPEDLKVTNIERNDPDYYSSLKLASNQPGESITIDVTSTEYTSLEAWEKNNKQLIRDSKDLKLADLTAKEINSKGKIMVIAVDLDTLITITANFAEENTSYWKNTIAKIVSTFAFEIPETSTATNDSESVESAEEDIVFEGEEVIE